MRFPLVSRKRYEAVKSERDDLYERLGVAIHWLGETAQERDEARLIELGVRRGEREDGENGVCHASADHVLRASRRTGHPNCPYCGHPAHKHGGWRRYGR